MSWGLTVLFYFWRCFKLSIIKKLKMINILQRKTSQQKSFPKSFLHMLDCVCVPVLSTQELSYSYACIWGENRRLGKPRMCKWQSKVTIQRHKEPFLRLHSIKAKVTIIYTFCASLKKMLLKDDTENLLNAFSKVSSLVDKRKKITAIDSYKNYYTDKHTLFAKIWQLEVFMKTVSNKTFC